MPHTEHFYHESELQMLSDEQRIARAKKVYESIPLELIVLNDKGGYGYMQINGLPLHFAVIPSHIEKTVTFNDETHSHPWHLVQTARPDRIDIQRTPVSDEAYTFMLDALGVDESTITKHAQEGSLDSLLKATVGDKREDYMKFSGFYVMDKTFKPDIELAIAARIEDFEEDQAASITESSDMIL